MFSFATNHKFFAPGSKFDSSYQRNELASSSWSSNQELDRGTAAHQGLCDMVHVSFVQGDCSPPNAQVDVTAYLSATIFANIPEISGILVCNAEIVADDDLAPWNAPDGQINAADVLIAIQLVLGQRTTGSLQYAHGDMNTDGVIDLADLLLIKQAVFQ